MVYTNERQMYPYVKIWLKDFLQNKVRGAELIQTYDTSKINLSNLLIRKGLQRYFGEEFITYDVKVDVTGVIIKNSKGRLALVECKLAPITLRDFSQLLGYSVVVKPFCSIILSPMGVSDNLTKLLTSFGRTDILRYHEKHEIALAKWDETKKDIDYMTLIPKGWSPKWQ